MRKFGRHLPARELEFAIFRSCGNEFDGSFYEAFPIVAVGEKYRALFGSAEVSKQREVSIDNLTDELFPSVGHDSPIRRCGWGLGTPIVPSIPPGWDRIGEGMVPTCSLPGQVSTALFYGPFYS